MQPSRALMEIAMNTKRKSTLSLMIGALLVVGGPLSGQETCKERLESAKVLTHYGTYMAQMLEFGESGGGTQQEADAVKERWLEGKKRGIAQLEQIIEDCEQEAKSAENPVEAARLLAVVFEAKVAWDTATPGSRKRDIYFDAVAAISAVDHHEETDAVVPFIAKAAVYAWDEGNPEEGIALMERAIEITGRLHGKASIERAEQLGNLAYLLKPATSPGRENRYVDVKRAKALYGEALAIYEEHSESTAAESYRTVVGEAQSFYQAIGEKGRADELAERHSALSKFGKAD